MHIINREHSDFNIPSVLGQNAALNPDFQLRPQEAGKFPGHIQSSCDRTQVRVSTDDNSEAHKHAVKQKKQSHFYNNAKDVKNPSFELEVLETGQFFLLMPINLLDITIIVTLYVIMIEKPSSIGDTITFHSYG